ncbi:MAG TPA: FAD/NAD(P)-binding oxidoreductase [archaeon]|nr:FAD/NAD(P)-binding oxidoreductase [archaeon]
MAKHIIILGGGFGGLAAAHALRKGLGAENKVTLVDKQPLFFMGLTKLWVMNGTRAVGDGPGNRILLNQKGINFIEGEVASINSSGKVVQIGKQKLSFDYLIIALGADYSTASTRGFSKYARDLYTESGCAEIRDELRSITSGSITILICDLPFKCPPAPYEAAFLVDDLLRNRGVRGRVSVRILTPEPHPLPILGPEAGKRLTDLLSEKEIEYFPSERVNEIRPGIVLTAGKQFSHTLLLAVPKHVVPDVLRKGGLADDSGWIPVEPRTLATKHPDMYAIGDCAGTRNPKGQLLPRAGAIAEEQGKVVAANLIHEITGEGSTQEFQGRGVCFMETGGGMAAPLRANFFSEPEPTWEFAPPSREGFMEKRRFLEDRMKAWFR